MDLWFSELHTPYVKFSIQIDKQLHSEQTEFQRIDIFESKEFGRMMVLDGYVMLTEKDEFIYHEMIVHVPMAVHPNPKRVLIIGGGDGGTARELLRYKNVESVDLVEIDERVVDISRKYLPQTACSFDDERLHCYFEDGLKFIRHCNNEYDLIIVDSTDPFGPGEGLFTKEFYGNCYRALKEDGIMVYQHGSPFYDEDEDTCRAMHRKASHSFPISRVYQAHIPTCASGYWLFGFTSKKYHPLTDLNVERWKERNIKTWYYTTNLHKGAFMLPRYVEDMLEEEEN